MFVRGGGNPLKGFNYGLEFKAGTRIAVDLRQAGDARPRCAPWSPAQGYADAVIQQVAVQQRRLEPSRSQTTHARRRPAARPQEGAQHSASRSRLPARRHDWNISTVGATFGHEVITLVVQGDRHRPGPDPGLRLVALPVEVRGRRDRGRVPRPVRRHRHLLAHRARGDDRHHRRGAHHPGLLALRHGHRLRPHPRERAQDVARALRRHGQPLHLGDPDAVDQHHADDPACRWSACCSSAARPSRTSPSRCWSAWLSGAYSSIFVASPVLTLLKEREPQVPQARAQGRRDLVARLAGRCAHAAAPGCLDLPQPPSPVEVEPAHAALRLVQRMRPQSVGNGHLAPLQRPSAS